MSTLLRPARWTLRTKLVTSILLLTLLVMGGVAALTVYRLNSTLTAQVSSQLTAVVASNQGPGGDGGGPGGDGGAPGGDDLHVAFQANGTVLTLTDRYTNIPRPQAWRTDGGRTISLTVQQVDQLRDAGLGAQPKDVDLSGGGKFRVVAYQADQPVISNGNRQDLTITRVYGVSLDPIRKTVAKTALSAALLSGAGLLFIALGATWIIRRTLEPLRRVSATATRVAQLPLSTGAVDMNERVPARDTDPNTEVGQVGLALNGMLDHVDGALKARHASEMQVRQFVADASHELRTPLASIRGYAELSRREREPVPQGVTHALGRIESEADRMTALVEDLLLLARLDSGRPLDHTPFDLTMVAIESVSDAHAAGRDHVWNLDLPDEAVEITGDEARIRQVLINLLANARRHTPPGTVVSTSLREEADGIHLRVNDNGPGIPPELVSHIFERFTRGDSARTRTEGSTGLGLSIVHAVAASHGGTVTVSSEPGNTTFDVLLPRVAPDASAEPAQSPDSIRA